MRADRALIDAVDALLAQPDGTGVTLAVVAMVDGAIAAEGYGPATTADTTLISWSMAKSVTHALIGLLVGDGLLEPGERAPIDEWRHDARHDITVQHLLNMRSGLTFVEDYVDDSVSHCIDMLFGSGKDDVAGYAAALPLLHEPGTAFSYSSGTTNILCGIAGRLLAPSQDATGRRTAVERYLSARLFDPLGMRSATPRFDAAGTFIGSSFLYATARDFAAFGELYRQDGCVRGVRLLPAGWSAHGVAPVLGTEHEAHGYGAHWWLWPEYRGFGAHGYEGQRILVIPDRRLTLVRLGKTAADDTAELERHLGMIVESVPVRVSSGAND
jgi:CubicO group peptidase (beta-lactamase class C family)